MRPGRLGHRTAGTVAVGRPPAPGSQPTAPHRHPHRTKIHNKPVVHSRPGCPQPRSTSGPLSVGAGRLARRVAPGNGWGLRLRTGWGVFAVQGVFCVLNAPSSATSPDQVRQPAPTRCGCARATGPQPELSDLGDRLPTPPRSQQGSGGAGRTRSAGDPSFSGQALTSADHALRTSSSPRGLDHLPTRLVQWPGAAWPRQHKGEGGRAPYFQGDDVRGQPQHRRRLTADARAVIPFSTSLLSWRSGDAARTHVLVFAYPPRKAGH